MPAPLTFDSDFLFAEACLDGETAALKRLGESLRCEVLPVLRRAGATMEQAEDLTQDLLSDLVVRGGGRAPLLRKFAGRCSLVSWLTRLAINRWLDLVRRRQRAAAAVQHLHGVEPSAAEAEPAEPLVPHLRESIRAALEKCSPEQFVLFRLLHSEGLRQQEVARIFGCSRHVIARRSEEILASVRRWIMEEFRIRVPDLDLTWDDLVQLCSAAATDVIVID